MVELFGYKIYENGTVIDKNGNNREKDKELRISPLKSVSKARLIYYAFNQKTFDFDNKSIIIKKKNKEDNDYRLSNLVEVKREGTTLKLTEEQVSEIKAIYSKYKENSIEKNCPTTKISYRKLADMYGVAHGTIRNIIKG